jgi:hypothetical protein
MMIFRIRIRGSFHEARGAWGAGGDPHNGDAMVVRGKVYLTRLGTVGKFGQWCPVLLVVG